MKITIYESNILHWVAEDENGVRIGVCGYNEHQESYYNNIDNIWTCANVNLCDWLYKSIKEKYPYATINIIK